MQLSKTLLALLWAVTAAGIGWYAVTVARQITYVTLADGRRAVRRIPFLFRFLLPWAPNLFPLTNLPAFAREHEKLDRQLTAAGFEDTLRPREFQALRLLMPLVPGLLWIGLILLLTQAVPSPILHKIRLPLAAMGFLWTATYPDLWLRREIRSRHNRIRRALPFTLDLLTLSVEAGMDFMTALQRNVERMEIDALNEELIRVLREIQLGKTRKEALRNMAARVQLDDLRSVVNALVQADELGVSIGTVLRIQSEQIRQKRFDRAERLANEAPVKMLFPLMVFIFPSVFLMLLGPVLVRMLQQGF